MAGLEIFDAPERKLPPWLLLPLRTLAMVTVVVLLFLMALLPDGRQPISAAMAECGEPVEEVCFDVVDGFVVERHVQALERR